MVRSAIFCALAALLSFGCATTAADKKDPTDPAGGGTKPVPELTERMRSAAEDLKAAYKAWMAVLEEDAKAKAASYAGAQTLEAAAAEALRVAKERTKAAKAFADAAAKRLSACQANETKCVPDTSGAVGSPPAR